MRILLVNKYNYLRSGTERYLFNLKNLLESQGHSVELFASQHPKNQPATYAPYFIPHLDFHHLSLVEKLRGLGQVIWNKQAARQIAQVLDLFQPDLVHLQNIYHHISPAILPAIKKRDIPIVQTLHDYKLICPNYLLYTKQAPCTRCQNGRYFQAVQHRCLHNSYSWSLVAAAEMTLHKAGNVYESYIDQFIAPSLFAKQMAESFGVASSQLCHIPYPLFATEHDQAKAAGSDVAYIGRLVKEKGLVTLIQAMAHLPDVPLKIVGEGDLRPELEALVSSLGLSNVQFTGYLAGAALEDAYAQARFTVLPSEWYEVFGQSILESFAAGKAVVAAEMGGITELVDDGLDGLLFPAGNVNALVRAIQTLWQNPQRSRIMGLNGRQKIQQRYTPEMHYEQLISLYRRLV